MDSESQVMYKVTHANSSDTYYIDLNLMFSVGYNSAGQCTHVMSNGGAILPVKEDVETITKAKEALNG